jgi:hypothetical protein
MPLARRIAQDDISFWHEGYATPELKTDRIEGRGE